MAREFWKNKRVLVTGSAGFLGSHLTRTLLESSAYVFGVDIKAQTKSPIVVRSKRFKFYQKNITDFTFLRNLIRGKRIHYVFHLAAAALVGECETKPLEAFSSNIEGTWKVFEACRQAKCVEGIVAASSDKAYGDHPGLPYLETMPLAGQHPYDVSKSCADLIAKTFFESYGSPVVVTRCGNIYGPGDINFSRIVPDTIRAACQGKTLLIRSDGKFSRDYVYIDDIVDGYLTLGENLKRKKLAGEAFNLSAERPLTVLELVKKIFMATGQSARFRILNQAHNEIRDQYLSSAKIRRTLGWKAKHDLDAGLQKTIEWYRQYLRKK